MRSLHSYLGLIAGLCISILAITGIYLSTGPILDHVSVASTPDMSIAKLADLAGQRISGIDRIGRKASGAILIHSASPDGQKKSILDPMTGKLTPKAAPSKIMEFAHELHRSLFVGKFGRGISGVSAAFLLLLTYSGLRMLVKRMGGWPNIFTLAQGTKSQRLHIDIARFTLLGFTLSALTGLYMSLVTFGMVSGGSTHSIPFPQDVATGSQIALKDMPALANINVSDLREITYPYPGDPMDIFTIQTKNGEGFIDQVTGKMIAFQANNFSQRIYEFIYMLHTGEGGGLASAIFALVLGLSAFGLPVLSITGIIIWWKRSRNTPKIPSNISLKSADTIILVGSEGNATWGFATTLHKALTAQGKRVRTDAMSAITQTHVNAKHVFILTSTYGDGIAPTSANGFIEKLRKLEIDNTTQFTVLGFGDKAFLNFCGFAKIVDDRLRSKQCQILHPLTKINQQSPQAFNDWGSCIGRKTGIKLCLEHVPNIPATKQIVLIDIVARSIETDAPTAILRFAVAQMNKGTTAPVEAYEAGDLIGIVPPGSNVPRYYSIASSSADGFIEICVKQHKSGLCSNYLLELNKDETINYFIKKNAHFKPNQDSTPIIMIGAGTGIAPLAGFVRENKSHRPTYLFWGGRNPQSDFIYKDTLTDLMAEEKLSKLFLAFSRITNRLYVQDKLKVEAELLKSLISQGAQIMVCGGPEMASSVKATVNDIMSPQGDFVGTLQKQKRYLEDVY